MCTCGFPTKRGSQCCSELATLSILASLTKYLLQFLLNFHLVYKQGQCLFEDSLYSLKCGHYIDLVCALIPLCSSI